MKRIEIETELGDTIGGMEVENWVWLVLDKPIGVVVTAQSVFEGNYKPVRLVYRQPDGTTIVTKRLERPELLEDAEIFHYFV